MGGGGILNKAITRWCSEYLFVFAALVVLKSVFFPFVLWWWFAPGDLTATLHEATSLVFTVISIIILLGLGSISRYRYSLSSLQVTGAFFAINVPFVILWLIPAASTWSEWWWGVVGDGLQLWLPGVSDIKGVLIFMASLILIMAGRRIRVRDNSPAPSKVRSMH